MLPGALTQHILVFAQWRFAFEQSLPCGGIQNYANYIRAWEVLGIWDRTPPRSANIEPIEVNWFRFSVFSFRLLVVCCSWPGPHPNDLHFISSISDPSLRTSPFWPGPATFLSYFHGVFVILLLGFAEFFALAWTNRFLPHGIDNLSYWWLRRALAQIRSLNLTLVYGFYSKFGPKTLYASRFKSLWYIILFDLWKRINKNVWMLMVKCQGMSLDHRSLF